MSSPQLASRSSREVNDDLHAYYSTASSYSLLHRYGCGSTQRWRERKIVEDSQASDETLETEELPERQTELDPYLPQEVLEDHFEFASTRPIFDNHQLDYQSRFPSTPPYVLSSDRRPQDQPIEQSGSATQLSDPTENEPEFQQQLIARSPPAPIASFDSQETQFSITASLDPQELPLDQHETVETVPVSKPINLSERVRSSPLQSIDVTIPAILTPDTSTPFL
ncbi:MAG: hypothetical protein Q9199_006171 [Rusavskia elegans]